MKLHRFRILILWTIIVLNLSFGLTVHAGDDCVNCPKAPKVEDPISSNSGATALAESLAGLAKSGQQQQDDGFYNFLNVFCMTYERLDGAYAFKKKLLQPMKKSTLDPDKFWYAPGCQPQMIGGTMSPIVHLTAENATDRLAFLKALHKHYVIDKGGNVAWSKIINAKNTRGQTVLDYLHYLVINKKLIKEEEKGVNELYQFLCANEGQYSEYSKAKSCQKSEYITIQ